MKSHQYASKRRLTNICCIVVALAFVKLVFAGYLAAGGELFAFPSPEKATKAQQIAEAEAKRIKAYQDAAQNYESSQRKLTQAVASIDPSNSKSQNLGEQNTSNNSTALNAIQENNNFSEHASKNFALGNERLEVCSGSRVSFLPQSRNNNNENIAEKKNDSQKNSVNTASTQNETHNLENNSTTHQASSLQNNGKRSEQILQNVNSLLERSDMVNDDLVLASASSITANSTRAQIRAHMMQEAFASYENTEPHALDNMEPEPSSYVHDTAISTSQNIASAPKSPSFFSLVGTAYAAEDVPYARPDEATSIPLPSPTVQSYSSPDSLEYKQSELNRKEEELLALQQQMNSRLRELNELEGRIGSMVQDASSMQGEKFKHLIETYTNMKARVAAQSLVTLDEDIAVRILSGMKSKQSGEIFSYMDPVQSARLSEAMSQFSL